MRVVYMGTPAFAIPPLEGLLRSGYEVVGVYTQSNRPVGRGRALVSPPVKSFAEEQSLKVFQPASLRSPEAYREIQSLEPELIVVAAYGKLLPGAVLQLPSKGCVNIHPSLLPRHRGPSPVAFTLLEGDEAAGVTLMLLSKAMDAGPIIARREETVLPDDTTGSLTERLFHLGTELLLESLPLYLRGELIPRPQGEAQATYTRKLSKEDGEVRWELPAISLWRQVRAYSPWPGSYTRWQGKLLKVLEAKPWPWDGPGSPGMVVALQSDAAASVGVVCGEGVLSLRIMQLEGKRAMNAGDFLLGHDGFVGSRLPC